MTIYRLLFFTLMSVLLSLSSCNTSQYKGDAKQESSIENTPSDLHTSQNALDWSGSYTGVLPCADCVGIETKIELHSNLSYKTSVKYLGKSPKSFESEGEFTWDESGSKVILQGENPPNAYKVIENALIALDMDGNVVDGDLKSNYRLKKSL